MAVADGPAGDGEASWETLPMYLALSSRISKTESTLASLATQVQELGKAVAVLSAASAPNAASFAPSASTSSSTFPSQPQNQPQRGPESTSTAPSIGSIASDDDARVTPGRQGSYTAGTIGDHSHAHPITASSSIPLLNGSLTAEPVNGDIGSTGAGADSGNLTQISANADNINALMQQVAALSMSVAQLQKIQTNQVQLTRSNSGSAPGGPVVGLTSAQGGAQGGVARAGAGTGAGAGASVGAGAQVAQTTAGHVVQGVDRSDNKTPTPSAAAGTFGSRANAAAAPAGRIGTGFAGSTAAPGPGALSRAAAPTQLGMNLPSFPSGPLPSALLSPPLSATTGPAGRRIDQANRPGMGRSISSSMINSHLGSVGAGPGQLPPPNANANANANENEGTAPGSRWPGHGYGPLSPAPSSLNPLANAVSVPPGISTASPSAAAVSSSSGPLNGSGTGNGSAKSLGGRLGGPPGHLQMPSLSMGMGMGMGMAERVWSPGGGAMMTPRVEITQSAAMSTPGLGGPGQGQGGAATPGAGIVVTKWDHLNLKPELLRGIVKYGIGPPNKIQARVLPFMLRGSDIIAQAPPTQERIIAYVIPSLQTCLTHMSTGQYRGPTVIIVTTTVDQATQCHKLVRNIGGPLGIRSALVAGVAGSSNIQNEIAAVQRDQVHLLIGTPAKLNEVVTARGPMGGSDCRLLVLDEVDQLIARNLYDNVLSIAKFLPAPRRGTALTPGAGAGAFSPVIERVTSPYDAGQSSPFNPNSKTPFPGQQGNARLGLAAGSAGGAGGIERQTCIFSNTIPTDVINFSQSLSVRDPVRVLVRRDGGPNSQESVSSVTPDINLKHTYVYLTITGSAAARADAAAAAVDGPGAIGSGRSAAAAQGGQSEEANRAREYKLDILTKMLDDYPMWQAIVHVGTFSMLEAVVLQSRNWETTYLAPDMPPAQRKSILSQWRMSSATPMQGGPRFMVIFDVNVKPPDIPWAPLIINFDLPRSVEGYAARAAAGVPPGGRGGLVAYQQQVLPGAVTSMGSAAAPGQGQNVFGVVVSFVQAAGGDVEMLRSTECAFRFKSAEIPAVFHDLF